VPWSGAPDCPVCHRTVSDAPPDSVRCTRGLQAELFTFGNSQRRFAIIHRTVRCTTGQCPVPQGRATLNSLASDFRSAIIHRTCPVHTCRRFDPGGSLDRRVNCRCVSQPRWVGARRDTKGENSKGKPVTFVLSCAQGGWMRLQ
jgi:hypothetical protein